MKFTTFWLILSLFTLLCLSASAQDRLKLKPQDPGKEPPAAQEAEEEQELRRAIESASGSPQQIVENLDAYLKKFPNSSHRTDIERELYKLSLELRDRNRVIAYGERLVAAKERDLETLTMLVSMLRERKAEGDLTKALNYADKLVKAVEEIFAGNFKPARVSAAQWTERKSRAFASVYLLRGEVKNDLNRDAEAEVDLKKSFQASPQASAASALGRLAEKRKNAEQAIDYYLQAFALSLESSEGVERAELRRKLGALYVAKNGSEMGLGDRLLKAYDMALRERTARLERLEGPNINAGNNDPLLFKLTKLSGGSLKLADYRGKVVVANFWATWCGPCREEMPQLEKTLAKYKDDPDVIFLAINTDEDRELVEPYVKAQKLKLPIVYAEYLDSYFGIQSIPTTLIFDRQGQVTFRQSGYSRQQDFVAAMSERIEAAKKKQPGVAN